MDDTELTLAIAKAMGLRVYEGPWDDAPFLARTDSGVPRPFSPLDGGADSAAMVTWLSVRGICFAVARNALGQPDKFENGVSVAPVFAVVFNPCEDPVQSESFWHAIGRAVVAVGGESDG